MLQSHLLLCCYGFCGASVTLCNVSVTLLKYTPDEHPMPDFMEFHGIGRDSSECDSCLTGGVDPGVYLTRRIFTINPSAIIPEVVEQHHDGCQYSNGVTLFYSTKSYQDKLFMNVPTSGMYSCSMIHNFWM